MLAVEAEGSWRRRGKLAQLLLALIIPKDQFSDHYLLSHTCRHTYFTDLERIYKLASEGLISGYRHPFALVVVSGSPVMANAETSKQLGSLVLLETVHAAISLFFSKAHVVSLGPFKSVFSLVIEQRLSRFLSQPDRHSYLPSQTSPLQHNRRKLFQASDKSHFYLWKSKRSKNTRL